MVFVKVRETYDLATVRNKLSLISIHTPKADIIKKNYPGLLMQCKSYRPVSCDVRLACASVLPADPLQVSTAEGDIAPEDLFNPILYKACTNQGMSQIEGYIARQGGLNINQNEVDGSSAGVDVDPTIVTTKGGSALSDHFDIYYGFLSDTNSWRHASPQAGLEMTNLHPLVYEMLYSIGDSSAQITGNTAWTVNLTNPTGPATIPDWTFKGKAHPLPFLNCGVYSSADNPSLGSIWPGYDAEGLNNSMTSVPAPQVVVGAIIVPPSRLHQLYYRMVVEWTLEFSGIRSIIEITNMAGVAAMGQTTHYQSYDYSAAKSLAGVEESTLKNDASLASASVDINKVM